MDDYQLDVFLHELKNPLTALKVLAKLLQKKLPEGDPNQALVAAMIHECERLETMVRSPKPDPEHPYDLRTFLQTYHPVYEALVNSYQQQLIWNSTPLPEPVYPALPAQQLRQILDNLILNACKFNAPGGTITVTASRDPQQLVLTVADSGSGIPAEAVERICVPYQRLRSDQPGQGLGLAIVKDLLEKSGGKIEVVSEPGQGSQFRVTIPVLAVGMSEVHESGGPDPCCG
ncbi:MAG: HAMP domain-containing sensor histidine kinase [Thermostichales cyanobacterium DRC_bins_46]